MKKLLLTAAFAALSFTTFAQNVDMLHKIRVSGKAEQEVTPDIINISISLQEYMNGRTKITIEQLENQLDTAVMEAGISKEDFRIDDISGYKNYYQKKKSADFLAGKQYSIRFHDLDKFNQILHRLDPKGIESTNVDSYDYSKMTQVKRALKIQALLAAKDKATYLLNSIGEKLGGVIDIDEVENDNYLMASQYTNISMNYNAKSESPNIDFKKIKLSFQLTAVFEIVK